MFSLAVGTYLATTLAHVRLFTGVDARVYCQRRSLDELLVAARIFADMRSNATMDTFYAQGQSGIDSWAVWDIHHGVQDHCVVRSLYHKCCRQMLFDQYIR